MIGPMSPNQSYSLILDYNFWCLEYPVHQLKRGTSSTILSHPRINYMNRFPVPIIVFASIVIGQKRKNPLDWQRRRLSYLVGSEVCAGHKAFRNNTFEI